MPRPDRSRTGHKVEIIHFHRGSGGRSLIRCACGWEADSEDQEQISVLFVAHRTEVLRAAAQ